jgi:hypothetical protein
MRELWAKMSFFLSRRSGDPRNPVKKFTKAHRRALEEFAALEISLEELRRRLAGVVEFDFREHERRLDSHYGTPVPGVRIELRHIRAAMEKQARGEISTELMTQDSGADETLSVPIPYAELGNPQSETRRIKGSISASACSV